ncbi:hypothetical protein [Chryseobacterium koreense]|uniref:Uncharacterized protein n=1 Tax=Chryseobacterium koreense CCUG 49689 TaxID=1304281 RepID=A0A0J7IW99_9FLAO|nr:hypothetical protein [Chryseobacterium koreense]KMQ70573.1 hypothetical protein ACM44_11685 [Chryseobacterium koreense CCUG 49689]MBB5334378.1 hypothetical protein [Chryseobacterium koreense]
MEQPKNIGKDREQQIEKNKKLSGKEKDVPFMQVDKNSDPISNFIANFKRQYREAKGLLNLERLFGGKRPEPPKPASEPESIIGATKTDMRLGFKNDEKSQTVQTGRKPALKMDSSIKPQQDPPKNKKPKLGL